MSTSHIRFCAIPEPYWQGAVDGIDIARFASDAVACERRIAKTVNLENEQPRYTLLCQQLEREVWQSGRLRPAQELVQFQAILRAGQFPVQLAEPGYLALLSAGDETDLTWRLGAGFFPPESIEAHVQQFEVWAATYGASDWPIVRQRVAFFRSALAAKCGIVELQSAFHPSVTAPEDDKPAYMSLGVAGDDDEQTVIIPDFILDNVDIEFLGKSKQKQRSANVLRRQIENAVQAGEPVSFGNTSPHDVITEVLHEFVFVPPGEALHPVPLRIMYADGSEAKSFPLFCLHERVENDALDVDPLRVALMSMRHLEMDPQIDYCWFRNREVSRTRTLSETDQFCYDITLEQLDESLELDDLALNMFHTGFEPAVIGFYRGIVRTLLKLRNQATTCNLAVTPFYFRGEQSPYQTGSLWQ